MYTRQLVSIHVPKYSRFPGKEEKAQEDFGHYLAGLIDSGGNFNNKQELVLVLKGIDFSLAYYIKKNLGYGSVKKLKDKDILLFIISKKEGINKVIHLINGKIRTMKIYNQIKYNIFSTSLPCTQGTFKEINNKELLNFQLNNNDLNKNWIRGICDSFCSFTNSKDSLSENNRLNFEIH
jgi:hypothetical protein